MKKAPHPNLFGTDGIRATVGTAPFTQDDLIRLGKALAQWAHNKYAKPQPHILMLHDTRISCNWVKACLKAGLLASSVKIYDAHVLPTPGAAVLMQEYSLLAAIDCAFIISASHNPFHDNGIKIIDHSGKLSLQDEQRITELFYAYNGNEKPDASGEALRAKTDYRTLGTEVMFDNATSLYCANIAAHFEPNMLKGLTIVLDCAHGATYRTAPRIFKKLGARIILLNNKPNGYNINEQCGALHPEELQQAVVAHEADAGFAFDGDGDRIVAVNYLGEVKEGDDILALLAEHPAYKNQTAVVGTVMTNCGLEAHLQKNNKILLRTNVGDKYIIQQMVAQDCMLGGEPSGHIICGDLLMAGDGVLAALRVMESILASGNRTMKSFEKYPSILINIKTLHKPDLTQEPFASIITEAQNALPSGRVVIRASGTEPLVRVMVEAQTHILAQEHAQNIAEKLIFLLTTSHQEHKNIITTNHGIL
jgi:phosphoglucosamine mutase